MSPSSPPAKSRKKGEAKFEKVKDGRGREIPRLWRRNDRFYAQIRLVGKSCRRLALVGPDNEPVKSVQEALDAVHELRKSNREGGQPVARRTPAFDELAETYQQYVRDTGAKKPKTIEHEKSALKRLKAFLGSMRLHKITCRTVQDYVQHRKQYFNARRSKSPHGEHEFFGNRAVNMDIIVLNNCLRFSKDRGYLNGKLPTADHKPLPYKARKRVLFTREQIERVCAEAVKLNPDGTPKYRNGEMLTDAIRFMSYCGARVTSALATRWSDVDWKNRQLHLRKAKYSKQNIIIDFNESLEAHLRDMQTRRLPDTDHMFPSNRNDGSVASLTKSLEIIREAAQVPNLRFHDLRHSFISQCVMANVDFMTIARWAGHSDGGMLIGKVYGHLSNEHAQQQARKVSFDTASVQPVKNAPPIQTQTDMSVPELLALVQKKLNTGDQRSDDSHTTPGVKQEGRCAR
jgi:integrase